MYFPKINDRDNDTKKIAFKPTIRQRSLADRCAISTIVSFIQFTIYSSVKDRSKSYVERMKTRAERRKEGIFVGSNELVKRRRNAKNREGVRFSRPRCRLKHPSPQKTTNFSSLSRRRNELKFLSVKNVRVHDLP